MVLALTGSPAMPCLSVRLSMQNFLKSFGCRLGGTFKSQAGRLTKSAREILQISSGAMPFCGSVIISSFHFSCECAFAISLTSFQIVLVLLTFKAMGDGQKSSVVA